MRRFKEPQVLIYDVERPYRPDLLAGHVDLKDIYAAEKGARSATTAAIARSAREIGWKTLKLPVSICK